MYGTSFVQCTSGFSASIEYTTKGWISGELHHFKAVVNHQSLSTPTVIEGQWTGKSSITKNKKTTDFLDLTTLQKPTPIVRPIEEQDQLESRRIWQKVSEALKSGDYATASAEKSAIENEQRAIRKEREANNETWTPAHFQQVKGEEIYGDLRQKIIDLADPKFIDTMGEGGWKFTS